MEHSSVGSSV